LTDWGNVVQDLGFKHLIMMNGLPNFRSSEETETKLARPGEISHRSRSISRGHHFPQVQPPNFKARIRGWTLKNVDIETDDDRYDTHTPQALGCSGCVIASKLLSVAAEWRLCSTVEKDGGRQSMCSRRKNEKS
jgi:hypothetical protein